MAESIDDSIMDMANYAIIEITEMDYEKNVANNLPDLDSVIASITNAIPEGTCRDELIKTANAYYKEEASKNSRITVHKALCNGLVSCCTSKYNDGLSSFVADIRNDINLVESAVKEKDSPESLIRRRTYLIQIAARCISKLTSRYMEQNERSYSATAPNCNRRHDGLRLTEKMSRQSISFGMLYLRLNKEKCMNTITKRDGRVVAFSPEKITNAILKAMHETELGEDAYLASKIAEDISKIESPKSVEEIQDLVEEALMASSRKDVAKRYIIYRNERTSIRMKTSDLFKKVYEKTSGVNIENANANVDEATFGGRKAEAANIIQKEIAIDSLISRDIADAHNDGLIYEHDLDSYNVGMHNCLNIDFKTVFKNGFRTRNGDVRPPAGFLTACQQFAVIDQCQSQVQFGGVGSIHQDFDFAPFVAMSFKRYFKDALEWIKHVPRSHVEQMDDSEFYLDNPKIQGTEEYAYAYAMLNREGRQGAESVYHNLNTLESRAGSQVPFTSTNFGRDTSTEGRLVSKWMLEASISGVGEHHQTSIFPISIFSYKKGVNADPGDPNYDLKQLAIKSLSRRIYPNWANGDWSQAHESDDNPDTIFSTMGCRTLIGYDRHGYGYERVGRGNNVPITIILPKIAIEYGICLGNRSEPDLDGFWNYFEDTLKLTERALVERFWHMAKQSPAAAPFMYENKTIRGLQDGDDTVYNALKHGTLAIGYIGISEMCYALFGKTHAQDKNAHAFALKVVARIAEFAAEASERNDLNFSCYATPAENLCRTALVKLRNQYGVIQGVTDKEWLTNSHHVCVDEKVSIYEKLEIEAPFCKYPTGGCITYIECESTFMQNTVAVESLIDYAFQKLDIPYLAINFPIDTCQDCGYQGEFNDHCPECGSTNYISLRRVTGYLSSDYRHFNAGKKAETENRVKHSAYTNFSEDARNED